MLIEIILQLGMNIGLPIVLFYVVKFALGALDKSMK